MSKATYQEINSRYTIEGTIEYNGQGKRVAGRYMVLVDGVQHGGKRDKSGAGDLTFATAKEARDYAIALDVLK